MILTKDIDVKIRKDNIEYFLTLGYNIKLKDIIIIPIFHLQKMSCKKVEVECDICHKIYSLTYNKYLKNIKKYNFCTCKKCSKIKRKMTNKKLYGTEYPIQLAEFKEKRENNNIEKYGIKNTLGIQEIRNKIIKTNIEKYGCENPQQNKKIKNKTENTNIKKFGFNTPLKNNDIKNKIKITNIEKYGVENVFENAEIKDKIKKDNLLKFGVEYASQRIDTRGKIKKGQIECAIGNQQNIKYDYNSDLYIIKCNTCGLYYKIPPQILSNRKSIKTELCTICHPIGSYSSSGYEKQLSEFIKNNHTEVITNTKKIIKPLELDIYIPELKLAFEFNGIWWHNELNKDKNYHLNKTEMCEQQGIRLIHIYEDDWLYKQEIVKSMILNILNKTSNDILAINCEIKEIIDNDIIRKFLINNHIQGFVGSKIKIGLFYNNELVSLMIFGNLKSTKITNDKYELLRFCDKLNTNIIGGINKLFEYFINKYNPFEITTYVDRSDNIGELYKKLEFIFIKKTDPNYYYVIDNIRQNKFNYKKTILVKEGFDPDKSEHQIMLDRKIYRIYDSGKLKFKYINS